MNTLLAIKPPRPNYLVYTFTLALIVGAGAGLLGLIIWGDGYLELIGALSGALLVWAYDELTTYRRLAVKLTDKSIVFPETWWTMNINTLLFSEVDAARTLVYNSENNFRNRIRYTFWSKKGDPFPISKYLYGRSRTKLLISTLSGEIKSLSSKSPAR